MGKCLLFIFLLIGCASIGQEIIGIGKVLNQKNEPIPYSTIRVCDLDTNLIEGVATDSLGRFEIALLQGKQYLLKVTNYEYRDTIIQISVGEDLIDITNIQIYMSPDIQLITDITITHTRKVIEKKVDRIVFNVGNSNHAQMASDALDLIARAPLVEVSNNSINIMGKQGAKILINDRLFPLSNDELFIFLRSIPAHEVERIEIITNPPAQYDAQGNAGLINVVTKKIKLLGTNGYIYTVYSQAYYPTGEITASLGRRMKKVNLYGNVNFRKGMIRPVEKQFVQDGDFQNNQKSNRTEDYQRIRGNFGIDYIPNNRNSLSLSYSGTQNVLELIDFTENNFGENSVVESTIRSEGLKNTRNGLNTANFNYQNNLDSLGGKLIVNVDYINYDYKTARNFTAFTYLSDSSYTTNRTNSTNQLLNIGTLSIDYHGVVKKMNWDAGLKSSMTRSEYINESYDIINEISVVDINQTNRFLYNENTNAAYLSGAYSFEKFELKLGLRGEYTSLSSYSVTLDQKNKREYFLLFPTFYALYKLKDLHAFSFSYGRRVNRPSYGALNPFKFYTTPNNYSQGNPLLKPSFSHNFELSYILANTIVLGGFFNIEANSITQAPIYYDSINTIAIIQSNIGENRSLGVNLIIPFKVKFLSGSLNAYYMKNQFRTNLPEFESTSNNHVFYFSVDSDFKWGQKNKHRISLSADVSPFKLRRGIDIISPMCLLNVSYKLGLFSNNFFITVGINDMFLLSQPPVQSISNGATIEYINTYDSRNIRVSFAYMFGNRKMKGNIKKEAKNTEEQNRI